jgi:uncharacterized protein YhfF
MQGNSWLGNLMIMGGDIRASCTGSYLYGAGIGTGGTRGSSGSANSTLTNLMIMNGTITATCEASYVYGAGIGTGQTGGLEDSANSTLTNLIIMNGTITATCAGSAEQWGAGIGPAGRLHPKVLLIRP